MYPEDAEAWAAIFTDTRSELYPNSREPGWDKIRAFPA